MKMTILAAALILSSGAVMAGQPLTDREMDQVTAGDFATFSLVMGNFSTMASALGDVVSVGGSITQLPTGVQVTSFSSSSSSSP